MREMRVTLIFSLNGDDESVIEELIVPFAEDDEEAGMSAAREAAAWLHDQADSLEEGASS